MYLLYTEKEGKTFHLNEILEESRKCLLEIVEPLYGL